MSVAERLCGPDYLFPHEIEGKAVEHDDQDLVFLNQEDTRKYLDVTRHKDPYKDDQPLILKVQRVGERGEDELLPAKQFVRGEDGNWVLVEGFSEIMEIYKKILPWDTFDSLCAQHPRRGRKSIFDMIHENGVTDEVLSLAARGAALKKPGQQLAS